PDPGVSVQCGTVARRPSRHPDADPAGVRRSGCGAARRGTLTNRRMPMLVRLIRNDMLQNKTVALAVLLFVAAAAALLALAAILAAHLAGALGDFMERAKTPHFMQMHAGDLDAGTVRDFAARHPGVADWQIVE